MLKWNKERVRGTSMMIFMMRKRNKVMIRLILLWMTFGIINVVLRSSNRILFFEHWTPIDSLFYIGLIFFFLMCLFIFMNNKHIVLRIALIVGFLGITFYATMYAMLLAKPISIYKKDGYTVYVSEWRFFFSGSDGFYLKENMLTYKLIGVGEQSEEVRTTYFIEDDVFYIIESHEAGSVKETTVSLLE